MNRLNGNVDAMTFGKVPWRSLGGGSH